jgi:hypothetical protein
MRDKVTDNRNVSILAAFAVFAVGVMINSVKVFGPGAAIEPITSAIVITQELPVDRS